MIYNPKLDTFIAIADASNLKKASELTNIDIDTLKKQLEELESDVGVKLIDKADSDITLTRSGKAFYEDAKDLIESSNKAIERAKRKATMQREVIRIGTSPLTPTIDLATLWPEIQKVCPSIEVKIIPLKANLKNAEEILKSLGDQIDLVFGIFDNTLSKVEDCSVLQLSQEPLRIAIPANHPFKDKESLTMDDLKGEKLLLTRRGWSRYLDKLRDDLIENYPEVTIIDLEHYDRDTFKYCEEENILLPIVQQWRGANPLKKTLPVDWEYTIPYGILYNQNPSETTQKLLKAFKQLVEKEEMQK